MTEEVILVDPDDQPIGVMNKMEAHQKGLLHRAFSIFIFNLNKEFLLQKRSGEKYHSANLWSNTCCSHPRPDEAILDAADRRLKEEMGMNVRLTSLYSFIYKVDFPNGLSEHELDHIIVGFSDDAPVLNKEEASEWKYISFEALQQDVSMHPETYTEWFKLSFEKTFSIIQK